MMGVVVSMQKAVVHNGSPKGPTAGGLTDESTVGTRPLARHISLLSSTTPAHLARVWLGLTRCHVDCNGEASLQAGQEGCIRLIEVVRVRSKCGNSSVESIE
jgi:hypothetical protein